MTRPTDPADTRLMGIIHAALLRDLGRARETAAVAPHPAERQRRALGEHVTWLMDFLHRHHTIEDEGLWPAVRAKNPAAGPLLDSLEQDHQHIEPAATALRDVATRYATSGDDQVRTALVSAIDDLVTVLAPHLEREVAEAMPVVAATLTDAELRQLDHDHALRGKSLPELAFEGHWLLDDIDPEGYDVVTHVLPPVPRFILVHGFARRYRRRARAIWHADAAAGASMAR